MASDHTSVAISEADEGLRIGAAMFDITGPAAEAGMFGYAKVGQLTSGIHMRLRARAFAFHEPQTHSHLAFVCAELGLVSEWVTQAVVQRLEAHPELPRGAYSRQNVMISATHTHCAPGGLSHYFIYSVHPPLHGADRQNFECVVAGIVEAVVRAHRNLQPAVIRVAAGVCLGASVNRSSDAYMANPEQERARYEYDTDKVMTLWRFDGLDGYPIGMINWFAVHPTSMGNWYTLITGDNKGYAAYEFEREQGTNHLMDRPRAFVAAFAQSNEGDVSPNICGPRIPCMQHKDFERMVTVATAQVECARKLYEEALTTTAIAGGIKFAHQYVDYCNIQLQKHWQLNSECPTSTSSGCIGVSMVSGTEFDGRGVPAIREGIRWGTYPKVTTLPELQSLQKEKPIIFPTARYGMSPKVLPLQLFCIADSLHIAAVPFEVTTMAGRRLRASLASSLNELLSSVKEVHEPVIAGLSNAYCGYMTTREEYAVQRYEGASTHFGPNQLVATCQQFEILAMAMHSISSSKPEHTVLGVGTSLSPPSIKGMGVLDYNIPVIHDGVASGVSFGTVVAGSDVFREYGWGSTVRVRFHAAHPKNNLRTQGTFLEVQRWMADNNRDVGGIWVIHADDGDINTTFQWERQGTFRSVAFVGMDEPVHADEEGQQQSENDVAESVDADSKSALSSPVTESDGFDADLFASMMRQKLIAYNVSWDPLMKVLQALGASLAKQQRIQQSSDALMKKMEDQVSALRNDLTRAEDEKKEASAVIDTMQNRVGEIQSQLEEIQGLGPLEGQEEQEQGAADSQEKLSVEESGDQNDTTPTIKSPRSPRTSSIGKQAFVSAKELADAKKELREEMKRALANAFGHDVLEAIDENNGEEHNEEGSTEAETGSALSDESPGSPGSRGATRKFQLPGAPFASAADLQQEIEKLHGLHDALNVKIAEHDQLLETLNGQIDKLDGLSPRLADENEAHNSEKNRQQDDVAETTHDILNDLKELKAVQDEHDQRLRDHDDAVEKHTAAIKALTDSLDDLSVQQQTVASMYSAGAPTSGGTDDGSSKENISADDSGKSSKNEKHAGRPTEAVSQPQLDLSLVFTKLADLRRSTDASLNSLQQSIKGVSGTTQSQQEQLDALRNNVVFNEHLQAHLVEARLAMQKELLARNQTFQDRTKPQLAEWRKALELTEDKLLQGTSDDETLHALQQMQRCYHRTLLSIAPLVNSPLSIAETLQTLSDEVKQLQNAVRLGVVPLRINDYSNHNENGESEPNKEDREEEYTRKLRYLDEEIDATLQVNITTEKKNDPLIKGLDAMREKLELLWSMWHRNYNVDHGQPSEVPASSGSSTNAYSSGDSQVAHDERRHSFHQRSADSLREMELRLSGAVRRLAMVEEDIERLNSLTSHLNASDINPGHAASDASSSVGSRRAPSTNNLRTELVMEEIEKLRKELYGEIAKLSTQSLAEGNGGSLSNSNSTTSLVSVDQRSMVEAATKQGDVLTDLYSQMTGRELDTRVYNSAEGQKQFYDNFIKEVTKKVSASINADKGGQRGPGIGGAANANVNYRLLLDNFAQKVDDRLEDAREFTTEELARLRKELMEQLKIRFEVALRDIRGELMLLQPTDGDSTAMGTKPVMCVACSRPVPVSTVIREAGSLPTDNANTEPVNPALPAEFVSLRCFSLLAIVVRTNKRILMCRTMIAQTTSLSSELGLKCQQTTGSSLMIGRNVSWYSIRADRPEISSRCRKILTLPFLTTAMRSKMVLNKPEGKRRRPPRQSHLNRVDNVVREVRLGNQTKFEPHSPTQMGPRLWVCARVAILLRLYSLMLIACLPRAFLARQAMELDRASRGRAYDTQ
ncbi:unnamed protein product [Phytophthora fragariaefolia]|uniref:ceramidase n=1 Tax=Phytophthora fragariaefolia TaxID=1490495 RepID=A0A9W6X3U9_9STRA|nr:unnamed protein product [Phytophthora fragariaefolia]